MRFEDSSFRGKTWKSLKSDSFDVCEDTCKLYNRCYAYSFNKENQTCDMKARPSKLRKAKNVVSGELRRSYIRPGMGKAEIKYRINKLLNAMFK